jgi:hypothetical protein
MKELRELIKMCGNMSQAAKFLGCSYIAMHSWATGKRTPSEMVKNHIRLAIGYLNQADELIRMANEIERLEGKNAANYF